MDIEEKDTSQEEPKMKESKKKENDFMGTMRNYQPTPRKLPIWTDEEYMKQIDKELCWFDEKSLYNHKKYKYFKRVEIILAAIIPVLISLSTANIVEKSFITNLSSYMQFLAAFAGVFLVIINKLFEVENFFKNWQSYRSTHMQLENEKMKYMTRCEPYDEEDAFPIFVSNMANILLEENIKWQQVNSRQKKNEERNIEDILKRIEGAKNPATQSPIKTDI